jgi:peptidoglycan hydrolase-like protein with peptidoglycan-binding domain
MSNKYYNSYKEFEDENKNVTSPEEKAVAGEEKEASPEEILAKAKNALAQANADDADSKKNKEEFTVAYNDILDQSRKAMGRRKKTWESTKDEIFGIVKALMLKFKVSDINALDKLKIRGDRRKVAHTYFSNSIKKDREAIASAEKAKIEKEKKIELEKNKKAEASAKEANVLNVSEENKKLAEQIKSTKTAETLSTALVGTVLQSVKLVQEFLTSKGIELGKADGKYGKNTKAGVIKFQEASKLEANGIVDNNTWKKILNIEEDLKMTTPKVSSSSKSSDSNKSSGSSKSTKSIYSDKEEKALSSIKGNRDENGEFTIKGDSLKGVLFESLGLLNEADGVINTAINKAKEAVDKKKDSNLDSNVLSKYANDLEVIVKPNYGLLIKYKGTDLGTFDYNIDEESGKMVVFPEVKAEISKAIKAKKEEIAKKNLDDTGIIILEADKTVKIKQSKLNELYENKGEATNQISLPFSNYETINIDVFKISLDDKSSYTIEFIDKSKLNDLTLAFADCLDSNIDDIDEENGGEMWYATKNLWNKCYMSTDTGVDENMSIKPVMVKLEALYAKEESGETLAGQLGQSLGSWDDEDNFEIGGRTESGAWFMKSAKNNVIRGRNFSKNNFIQGKGTVTTKPDTYFKLEILPEA